MLLLWDKIRAWLPFIIFLVAAAITWWYFRERAWPIEEIEEELFVAKARSKAAEILAERGVTAAKAAVIAEHAATLEKMDVEMANAADKLAHGDPVALAELLVRVGRSGKEKK